jgi:hypothetical protein
MNDSPQDKGGPTLAMPLTATGRTFLDFPSILGLAYPIALLRSAMAHSESYRRVGTGQRL